jgi:diguanylate cyclase (GGDEF)-like protein
VARRSARLISGSDPAGERWAVLWRLLDLSEREDQTTFLDLLDDSTDLLAATPDPFWAAWRHAFAAHRAVLEGAPDDAAAEVARAGEQLDRCPPSADVALTTAYLASVQVTAEHLDSAMLIAVDASLLCEGPAAESASRALLQAHRWLSLTLSGLDLPELAVAHAARGHELAAALPGLADQWRMLLLSAQQHAELAQTLRRGGDQERARELAEEAITRATAARELPWEPGNEDAALLDVVQAWAMKCSGDLDGALGPLRRVRRRVQAEAGVWLRGFTDLILGRLLGRLAERERTAGADGIAFGEEAVGLLVDAAGAFAAAGDRRRYRQSLLELGQLTADLGRPAEALHWLEAYRTDAGRAHAHGREMWAQMFVRRSRLRDAERQTAVLRRHALEDPLTGLGNRRSAERRLGALRLGEEALSLAVVDVDHFKEVNDDTSHTHGDAVLRRVADLLREHSRTGDEVYRWAGDEFLVVLPTASEAQAVAVMERLRAAVAGADWAALELPEPVTVSIGVASAPAGTASATDAGQDDGPAVPTIVGWRALFDSADLNLFSAKRSGRNRVRAPGSPSGDDSEQEADRTGPSRNGDESIGNGA